VNRSFRFHLALRAAGAVAAGMVAVAVLTFLSLRTILDGELNASILGVASIQAASLTDGAAGDMHFHEWELTPDEAASLQDLIRYAQVWQVDGMSLLRSRYMTRDLPVEPANLDAAADGRLVWAEDVWEGVRVRSLYYPLERFGPVHGQHVLQVAAPLTARNDMLARIGGFLAALALLIPAATYAGAWWLAGRAMRPVYEIIDHAEAFEASSLNQRIQAYAETREYRRLVDVLNGMLARIERAFDSQKRFTADASHELRSPLTAMRGELEIALRRPREAAEYRRVVESTLEEVVRLSRITEDLLLLARSDSGVLLPRVEHTSVPEVVSHIADRLQGKADAKGITVDVMAPSDAVAQVDAGLLGQIAWNLIENAIKFTPAGGRICVAVTESEGSVVLEIRDTGPGFVDPEKAFTRFYRDDIARTHRIPTEGTGLGLAIVQAVAEAHAGRVRAENLPGAGACVTVTLPRLVGPTGGTNPGRTMDPGPAGAVSS